MVHNRPPLDRNAGSVYASLNARMYLSEYARVYANQYIRLAIHAEFMYLSHTQTVVSAQSGTCHQLRRKAIRSWKPILLA